MGFRMQERGIEDNPLKTPTDNDKHFALTSLRVVWISRARLPPSLLKEVEGSNVLLTGRGTEEMRVTTAPI